MSVNLSDFLSTTYVGATGPSGPQGPSSGTITVVASGVIPSAGLPVALNADGTVSVVGSEYRTRNDSE